MSLATKTNNKHNNKKPKTAAKSGKPESSNKLRNFNKSFKK